MPLKLQSTGGGTVTLDVPSTSSTVTLTIPANTGNLVVTDSSGNANISGNLIATGTVAMASSFKRNRIINGNMLVDQRNAGAAVGTSINGYTLDRWVIGQSTSGKLNGGQNYNSVTPPAGFANYLGAQSQSAYSVGASDTYRFVQKIEGYNIADMAWGTADAKSVTLSFWVRSSLTGTFGGGIANNAFNRTYVFTYTINAANTWEYKTITIAGDTTGTWLTTNGTGFDFNFSLGTGSTYSWTAGVWSSSQYLSATGAVSVVGTNGATFYITGVQLEVGTKATPYEMQIYSDQLAQCQRYYWKYSSAIAYGPYAMGHGISSTAMRVMLQYPVTMRSTPTLTTGGTFIWGYGNSVSAIAAASYTYNTFSLDCTTTGLTAFGAYMLTDAGSNNSYIAVASEL